MSTTERLGDHAHQVADTAKDQTRELAHQATDHARNLIGRATEELRGQGDEQGRRMAQTVRSVTDDLRSMSEHSTGATPVAEVMCGIADAGDRMADRLEREGVAGFARSIADYGRRSPGRFLLMSAAAGVVAGRLLRNADTTAIKDAVSGDASPDAGTGLPPIGGEPGGDDLPPIELPGDVAVPSGAPVTSGVPGAVDPGTAPGAPGPGIGGNGGLR